MENFRIYNHNEENNTQYAMNSNGVWYYQVTSNDSFGTAYFSGWCPFYGQVKIEALSPSSFFVRRDAVNDEKGA